MTEPELTPEDLERLMALSDDPVIAFFQARQAEDEARARGVQDNSDPWPGQWVADSNAGGHQALRTYNGWVLAVSGPSAGEFMPGVLAHIAAHDPATVLADIEARRTIFGLQTSDHAPIETVYGPACRTCVSWLANEESQEEEFGIAIPVSWPCGVARAFTARWAGHPDYDPAWRPQ